MSDPLTIRIPGEPCAQGRPRAFKLPNGQIRAFDPKKSRNWKAVACDLIEQARGGPDLEILFPEGPVQVHILAVFTCPKGDWRKREPMPRRPNPKRPDAENVVKAVLDAVTMAGVWTDDSQVARLVADKLIGAQGEAPYVEVTVEPLG